MAANVTQVTDANFNTEVLQASTPVLVDFWAPWCGPCRAIAPVVEELANEYAGRIKFAKLNVDENGSTATQYGVMSIPTLMIFKNGQVVDKVIGFTPKEELVGRLESLV